jgi:hypothetical protein
MRRALLTILGTTLLHVSAYTWAQDLPVIDFERYFPHLVATSEQIRGRRSGQELQWKFITVRDEQDKLVWVRLTRREGQDRVVQVFLAKGPLEDSEATFREAVAQFSNTENIRFEIVDLRNVRSFEVFKQRAAGIGLDIRALAK